MVSVSTLPSDATSSVHTSAVTFPLAALTTLLSLPPILLKAGAVLRLAPNPIVETANTAIPITARIDIFILKTYSFRLLSFSSFILKKYLWKNLSFKMVMARTKRICPLWAHYMLPKKY
jgi:hypothetical protein